MVVGFRPTVKISFQKSFSTLISEDVNNHRGNYPDAAKCDISTVNDGHFDRSFSITCFLSHVGRL